MLAGRAANGEDGFHVQHRQDAADKAWEGPSIPGNCATSFVGLRFLKNNFSRNYENEACLTLWILFSLLIFGWRVWQKVQGL